jgi:hypothetical protein
MNPLEQVLLGVHALARAAGRIGSGALWVPFALFGAIQVLAVLSVWWVVHPALAWYAVPLVTAAAGPVALHYPDNLALLPVLFGRLDLVLRAVLGPLVTGTATLLFAARFGAVPLGVGAAVSGALRRAPALVLTALPAHLLAFGIAAGLERAAAAAGSGLGPLVHRVALAAGLAATVLVQAMALFMPALVLLEGRGILGAFGALPRAWGRGLAAAVLLCAALLVPPAPLEWLLRHAGRIAERGAPEGVAALVLAQVGVSLLAWFLLAGAATLVFLSAVHERDPGRDT